MGWAKYLEDDISIYVGRMAVRDSIPAVIQKNNDRQAAPAIKDEEREIPCIPDTQGETFCGKGGRRGLELRFQNGPDADTVRKLQMNGWWWSKSRACWCNLDTQGNRKYAQHFRKTYDMHLVVVKQ